MSTWVVQPKDLGKFERKLQNQLRLVASQEMRAVKPRVEGLLRERSVRIRDRGAFQSSWLVVVRFLTMEAKNTAEHSLFVEGSEKTHPYSRRPNRKMPPLQVIRDWLARRGADPKLAFVVARAIARRGILARPVLRSPNVRSLISDMISEAMRHARDVAIRASR